jgi:Flp pilus assembly protein TadG
MRSRDLHLKKDTRGVAAVEMAMILPVFLTLILGMLEATRLGMATQTLTNAAREGCRVAVLPEYSQDDVQKRINSVLSGSGFTLMTVSPSPDNWTTAPEGTAITVTLELPYSQVSWLNDPFQLGFRDITVTDSATMSSQRP